MKSLRRMPSNRVVLDTGTGFIVGTMAAPVAFCLLYLGIGLVRQDSSSPTFPRDERAVFWLGGLVGAMIGAAVGFHARRSSDTGDAATVVVGACAGVIIVLTTT